jgi:hypothetical protein
MRSGERHVVLQRQAIPQHHVVRVLEAKPLAARLLDRLVLGEATA